MNYSKLARVVAIAAFVGAMPIIAAAQSAPVDGSPQVPVSGEILEGYHSPNVTARLKAIKLDRKVNLEINRASHGPNLDSVARHEYVAAQRDFRAGQYDEAVSDLQLAQKALESTSDQQHMTD